MIVKLIGMVQSRTQRGVEVIAEIGERRGRRGR